MRLRSTPSTLGDTMPKRIFDTDPLTGIPRYWHVKDNGEYGIDLNRYSFKNL